jgi:hypothetical protein
VNPFAVHNSRHRVRERRHIKFLSHHVFHAAMMVPNPSAAYDSRMPLELDSVIFQAGKAYFLQHYAAALPWHMPPMDLRR